MRRSETSAPIPEPVLIAWHSHGGKAAVLEQALGLLRDRGVRVRRVVYLVQNKADVPRDLAVELTPVHLPLRDPTRHSDIYAAVRERVLPLVEHVSELHVNVSPGTPAMHSVWLVLFAGGAFPTGTKLWSTQLPKGGSPRVDPVDFEITTYLSEARALRRSDARRAHYEPEARSPARREALERLARFAAVPDVPLLVRGERGTGKTRHVEGVLARIKGGKGTVALACGGLTGQLAESTLFGHVRGAFTGADRERKGLLAEANGGVLFLDEVHDLPREVQRKLIRVLQDPDRHYRPLGSDRELSSSFELVCATNLSVSELRGRLDEDFYDRISHLSVEIPPLRMCREDVRSDWEAVWRELAGREGTAPWSPAIAITLAEDELRGNLRDLQKLAALLRAWGGAAGAARAVKDWLRDRSPDVTSSDAERFYSGSRDERHRAFARDLAEWAHGAFQTWGAAAGALDCDPKTLRKDAAR